VINQDVIDLKINKADDKFALDATLEHLFFYDYVVARSRFGSLSLSLSRNEGGGGKL